MVKLSASHRRANIRSDWKNKIKYLFYSKVWCRVTSKDCVVCGKFMQCQRYNNRGWFE